MPQVVAESEHIDDVADGLADLREGGEVDLHEGIEEALKADDQNVSAWMALTEIAAQKDNVVQDYALVIASGSGPATPSTPGWARHQAARMFRFSSAPSGP